MLKLLIFTDWYSPAFKAGGPIQSCINMVRRLREYSSILVITSAYDLHDTDPLQNVALNEYQLEDETTHVKYLSRDRFGVKTIKNEIVRFDPDFIYLNGLFSIPFSIDVVLAHRILKHRSKIVVATHGVLKPTALRRKWIKKFLFLKLVKLFKIQHALIFHAANLDEEGEIKKIFGEVKIYNINHLSSPVSYFIPKTEKKNGQLNMILVGRVHPIKNIDYILPILKRVNGKIKIRIIGDLEDKIYLNKCKRIAENSSDNIEVKFEGVIPNKMIKEQLVDSHLFILPTLGENYGHAIIEALSVGRPVLISDQTPWRNLEENKAGWDLPLSDPGIWLGKINEAADWDQDSFDAWCQGALDYAKAHTHTEELVEKYREMFGG